MDRNRCLVILLQLVRPTTHSERDGLPASSGFTFFPVGLGAFSARKHFGGVLSQEIRPARIAGSLARLGKIALAGRFLLGLLVERQQFIPAPGKIEKAIERGTQDLKASVLALHQA